MIMQLAGDADAGPLTIDRDDPDDYKDGYSGGVSPPPSPPPAASPAPSMAPGHGSSSPGLGGLAGLHHALHGLHNLHNLHNLQNFHNLQQNLQTQMAALAGLQGGLGVPSVSSLLHPHLAAAAAAQQHPAATAVAAAAAAPPPTNINTGNNGAGNSNNNAANVPQMVLTSGHVTQGVQGAQLLVPTSQGIAVQPILTIPLGQPGVGSSSLMNPLVPLHHLHQPSPHHQHTDQQQQQQQHQQQQQPQQQQHHHHHHHHVSRSGGPSQVCEANDANDATSEHNESKSFPFRLPWRTLSSAASSPLPPSTSSNSSSSSSCSSTSAAPHPLLGLAGLPPSLFHHAHNNNNNNNSNNNNNNNNMGSPDSKPKLPMPLSSPVTDAIGSLGARMGHYPGPPPPPPTARYSPDFLDNHNQPTISQSTGNLVDGVNLDEIKEFAKAFKIRRLSMGLTQTQVGQRRARAKLRR